MNPLLITTIAAKDLQRLANTLDYLVHGLDPEASIHIPNKNVRDALIQSAGSIRFLLDALASHPGAGEEQLASAAILARRQGHWYFCFECLQGFNGTFCPRCDQAESDI